MVIEDDLRWLKVTICRIDETSLNESFRDQSTYSRARPSYVIVSLISIQVKDHLTLLNIKDEKLNTETE